MIKAQGVTKYFEDFCALDHVSCEIPKGCIYGMVGSNGAGKSTFLRILSGIYQLNSGSVTIDDQPIFENPAIKEKIVFVPDELYFLPNADLRRMEKLYASIYPRFDKKRFQTLIAAFQLPANRPINNFSKGMKRQASTILALSARPEYLFFDETFDGLDPVMRSYVKSLICDDVLEHQTTAIITSHSLRELEDTCDQLVLLHKGGVVLQSDVQNLKTSLFKVQIAFSTPFDASLFSDINVVGFSKQGSVANLIIRGDREETTELLKAKEPLLLEVLPLTLEEVFQHEMKKLGYDFESIKKEWENE